MGFEATDVPDLTRIAKLTSVLKKVAPWAVAGAILYFLFSRVPLVDAWAAARAADLGRVRKMQAPES